MNPLNFLLLTSLMLAATAVPLEKVGVVAAPHLTRRTPAGSDGLPGDDTPSKSSPATLPSPSTPSSPEAEATPRSPLPIPPPILPSSHSTSSSSSSSSPASSSNSPSPASSLPSTPSTNQDKNTKLPESSVPPTDTTLDKGSSSNSDLRKDNKSSLRSGNSVPVADSNSNEKVQASGSSDNSSENGTAGASSAAQSLQMAGIAIGCIVLVAAVGIFVVRKWKLKPSNRRRERVEAGQFAPRSDTSDAMFLRGLHDH